MEKIFQNKVVLITGGSFGIGRATAVAFARRGARVIIADCKEDQEATTIKLVKQEGSEASFFRCDISSNNEVKALLEQVIANYGKLDYAFNNAGIEGAMTLLHECSEETWDQTLNVNLKGAWLCMKYEIVQMRRQGFGVIVNNASVAGLKGFAQSSAYTASKHGLVGLTKTAALENAKEGIRINALCPGVVHTPMIDRVTKGSLEQEQQFARLQPMNRMGRPEEIAEAVVWLCSEAASFVTGQAIAVDGGLMAG